MTKIMLVEDDKSLREIYGVRLLAEGYEIISAGDGEEALAIAIKEHPDLIVSDVMMPKISGFDMLDILRATPETQNIKVIMMTALSSEDQRARGEALGADRYLVKSQVGIEDVVRTIHEILNDTQKPENKPAQTFGAPAPSETTITPEEQPTEEINNETEMPQEPLMTANPQQDISNSITAPVLESTSISIPNTQPVNTFNQPVPDIDEVQSQLPKPNTPSYPTTSEIEVNTYTPNPAQNETPPVNPEIGEDMSDRLNKDFKDGSDTNQTKHFGN